MKASTRQLASVARFELGALLRWLTLCVGVGLAAGLAASLFVDAVDALQFAALDRLLGVALARPDGEPAEVMVVSPLLPLWVLPLVPALGGLLCGLIARALGPRVYGGGTDHVLASYHEERGLIGWRVPLGKWLGSVATLGTGGSGGREGPMTLVGAGLGSLAARLFRLGDRERRLLVLAGAGAAIGAVFRIPLGSAIFAIEILYRDGFEEGAIFPCLIASVSGYALFSALHGTAHLFATPAFGGLAMSTLPLFLLVGLAVVPFGYLFTRLLRLVKEGAARSRLPRWLQPCAGGLAVGALGLAIDPELMGIGYGWLQRQLVPAPGGPVGLAAAGLVLTFAVGKIVATALTFGSGGSGGTFAPAVVTGGLVGAAIGQTLGVLMPGSAPDPAAFVLVGMGAFIGGVAHVPLAAVIIVCELVGNYDLLVPLMIAVGVAYPLLRGTTLYPAQVRNAAASPVWAGIIASDALQTLRVADLGMLRPAAAPVRGNLPLAALIARLAQNRDSIFPVEGSDGTVRGMVTLSDLRAALDSGSLLPTLIVDDAAEPLVSVSPRDSVRRVLQALDIHGTEELLVQDASGRLIGVVGHQDLARLTVLDASRRGALARDGHSP